MANASPVQCQVVKDGTLTCMARVVGNANANITQATISAATYSILLVDEDDEDTETIVADHEGVALIIASVVFDALQTDAKWSVDATGYNFAHQIVVSTNAAFGLVGRKYRVRFSLTPTSGQVIKLAPFEVTVV